MEDHIRIRVRSVYALRRLEAVHSVAMIIHIAVLRRNARPCGIFSVSTAVIVCIDRLSAAIAPIFFISDVRASERGRSGPGNGYESLQKVWGSAPENGSLLQPVRREGSGESGGEESGAA